MDNPYNTQIAGQHYVNMGMQPFHFAMFNGWDAGAFSILKYLSRHRTKNGIEDLRKTLHFVDLRQAELANALTPRILTAISIGSYISENKLSGFDAMALVHLEEWVYSHSDIARKFLIIAIDQLMAEYSTTPLP